MKENIARNWNLFISEIAEEETPLPELKTDLSEAGINVDQFLSEIKETVRTGYRDMSRKVSNAGISEKRARLDSALSSITGLSRRQIFKKIRQLAESGNTEALVFCREKNGGNLSDEELKYLLADFIVNGGNGDVDR